MHDNDFCRGCHIFVPSGQLFVQPDTGTYLLVNELEGKHDSLSCHACHPFELKAQTKELFYWIVARPGQDPAPCQGAEDDLRAVPRQGEAKKTWQRIASTAGHRTHLESDSSALKDVAVPHLPRADRPPVPAGRHDLRPEGLPPDRRGQDQAGRMAARFDAGQPAHSQRGAALLQLLPPVHGRGPVRDPGFGRRHAAARASGSASAATRCARCSPASIPAKDPHGGSCGMCHNPHTDVKPTDALKSCADAECHANWRGVAFHVGAAHRKVAEQCRDLPRAARRPGGRERLHRMPHAVRKGDGRMQPPLPFDTTEGSAAESPPVEPRPDTRREARAWSNRGAPRARRCTVPTSHPGGRSPTASLADTFSHRTHRELACITCHSTVVADATI